jgi:hypothetical protein
MLWSNGSTRPSTTIYGRWHLLSWWASWQVWRIFIRCHESNQFYSSTHATPTQLVFRRDASYQSLSKLTGTTLPKGNSALSCKTTNERTPSGALTPTVSMTKSWSARAESQTWQTHLKVPICYRSKW